MLFVCAVVKCLKLSKMDNFNNYKDLQDHFADVKSIIEKHNVIHKASQDLENIVEELTREIEASKKSQENALQQLQTISNTAEPEAQINTLYITLKENYKDLQGKYNEILKENALLQERQVSKQAEMEEAFRLEKIRMLEDLTKQATEQRNQFLQREQELSNELQLAQASNALQYDEMEVVQQQLRNVNQSCCMLQEEYSSFKMCSNYDLDVANKHIHDLERKLQLTEQQLRITQEQLFNVTKNKGLETHSCRAAASTNLNQQQMRPALGVYANTNKPAAIYDEGRSEMDDSPQYSTAATTKPSKYSSLSISGPKAAANVNQNSCELEQLQGVSYKNLQKELFKNHQPATTTSKRVGDSNIKSFLPALKQISKSAQKPPYSKRRRLYNPE